MCELFGMSANRPVTAGEILAEFRLRGGLTADNPDGWGLAWWENGVFRLAKEPQPASQSILFESLCSSIRTNLVVAHVRKAKFPPINEMNNTHPFQRTCCGKSWVFAHNGLVPEIVQIEQGNDKAICRPMGETDSEYAFCHLLSHLAQDIHGAPPDWEGEWFTTLARISELVATHGKFNFLMSDGEYLLAYGHDHLHYLEQNGTNGVDGRPFETAMIATTPLFDSENWMAFSPGELRIYRYGRIAGQIPASGATPAVIQKEAIR